MKHLKLSNYATQKVRTQEVQKAANVFRIQSRSKTVIMAKRKKKIKEVELPKVQPLCVNANQLQIIFPVHWDELMIDVEIVKSKKLCSVLNQ